MIKLKPLQPLILIELIADADTRASIIGDTGVVDAIVIVVHLDAPAWHQLHKTLQRPCNVIHLLQIAWQA